MDFASIMTHAPVVADGAMGTVLLDAGLRLGEPAELWNMLPERHGLIRAIHRSYQEAGARIVLTNSLGGNPLRLGRAGLANRLDELNRAAAMLAREGAGRGALVAGSMGPTAESLSNAGAPSYAEAMNGFAAQAAALRAGGVDLLWVETMGDPVEARTAALGARQAAPLLPIVVTFSFNDQGRTYTGATTDEIAVALRDLDIAAVGANCGAGPAATEAALVALRRALPGIPLVAKSNLGTPTLRDGRAVYDIDPITFAAHARRVRALGAAIIGACCGSTPEHVRAVAHILADAATIAKE